MKKSSSIAGGILVGGSGRRLGGVDKSRLRLPSKQTFADRQHKLLLSLCDDVWFLGHSSSSESVEYEQRLPDFSGEYGPLAGIASGLRTVAERLLVIPCDLPYISRRVLAQLIQTEGSTPIYAGTATQTHPLVSVWHKSHLPAVVEGARESRSVRSVLSDLNAVLVLFGEERDFLNVNTPADLALVNAVASKCY